MKVLVIDVGGTNIKIKVSNKDEVRKFPSGPDITGKQMVADVLENSSDWAYDCVTIGFPGPVVNGKIRNEPVNLGPGWVNIDFEKAFGKPVRIINDAAMQALGCYEGGRMLFLGLGTGLGTTLIVDGVVAALEAGHLPFKKNKSFEYYVGVKALNRSSRKHWQDNVFEVIKLLKDAMVADYVVLGGGNIKKLDSLPDGVKKGDNSYAFLGGVRFWDNKAPEKSKNKK